MSTEGKAAGNITALLKAVSASILALNPAPKRNARNSEVIYLPVRVEVAGQTWGGTLPLTRHGSRFDNMTPEQAAQAKAKERLADAIEAAKAAGLSV